MKSIEYEGNSFEYDEQSLSDYKLLKRISRAQKDLGGFFEALDMLFVGRDEEYAEVLNNDFDKLAELIQQIIEAEGEAKNS